VRLALRVADGLVTLQAPAAASPFSRAEAAVEFGSHLNIVLIKTNAPGKEGFPEKSSLPTTRLEDGVRLPDSFPDFLSPNSFPDFLSPNSFPGFLSPNSFPGFLSPNSFPDFLSPNSFPGFLSPNSFPDFLSPNFFPDFVSPSSPSSTILHVQFNAFC
jgi:hypothetical protein